MGKRLIDEFRSVKIGNYHLKGHRGDSLAFFPQGNGHPVSPFLSLSQLVQFAALLLSHGLTKLHSPDHYIPIQFLTGASIDRLQKLKQVIEESGKGRIILPESERKVLSGDLYIGEVLLRPIRVGQEYQLLNPGKTQDNPAPEIPYGMALDLSAMILRDELVRQSSSLNHLWIPWAPSRSPSAWIGLSLNKIDADTWQGTPATKCSSGDETNQSTPKTSEVEPAPVPTEVKEIPKGVELIQVEEGVKEVEVSLPVFLGLIKEMMRIAEGGGLPPEANDFVAASRLTVRGFLNSLSDMVPAPVTLVEGEPETVLALLQRARSIVAGSSAKALDDGANYALEILAEATAAFDEFLSRKEEEFIARLAKLEEDARDRVVQANITANLVDRRVEEVSKREVSVAKREEVLRSMEEQLAARERIISEREDRFAELEGSSLPSEELLAREAAVAAKEGELDQREATLLEREARLTERLIPVGRDLFRHVEELLGSVN